MGRLHPFRMANRSFALTSTQAGYLMYSIRLRRCKSDFPTCLISPSVIIFLGDRGLEKARSTTAFPEILAGRLPRVDLLRPAQRSLTFRPAYSLNRPRRSVTPKASTDSLSPRPLRLLSTGATRRRVGIASTGNRWLSRRTIYVPYEVVTDIGHNSNIQEQSNNQSDGRSRLNRSKLTRLETVRSAGRTEW